MLEHNGIMPSGLGTCIDTVVFGGRNDWTEIKKKHLIVLISNNPQINQFSINIIGSCW
jgi:hypothetical protein